MSLSKDKDGLNVKERLFALEYLATKNVIQSALAAGYKKSVAENKAHCWFSETHKEYKPHLIDFINKRLKKVEKELDVDIKLTVASVLDELSNLVYFNPKNLFDENGELKAIKDLDDTTAKAITALEISELFDKDENGKRINVGQLKKLKFENKKGSIDSAMRYLGLFKDKVEVTNKTIDDYIVKLAEKQKNE